MRIATTSIHLDADGSSWLCAGTSGVSVMADAWARRLADGTADLALWYHPSDEPVFSAADTGKRCST